MKYHIALTFLEGVGVITGRKLIEGLGSAEVIFRERKGILTKIPGLGKKQVDMMVSGREKAIQRADREMECMEKQGIRCWGYGQRGYPSRLKECYDAPLVLYHKGKVELEKKKIIGIVGTRNATPYGRELCEEVISRMAEKEVVVVSGLAYGVDIHAHRAALRSGIPTVGVFGHGLDRVYPRAHTRDAREMIKDGGLVTEFPLGTDPDRENFPKRNRVIAGLVDGLLVVESKRKGGAMITAEIANSYSRDVLAFPGRVGDQVSEGCNWLIKRNKAALIEDVEDLFYCMNWGAGKPVEKEERPSPVQQELFDALSEEEQQLVAFLKEGKKVNIDQLSVEMNLSVSKLAPLLLEMEIRGLVVSLPGKVYALKQ